MMVSGTVDGISEFEPKGRRLSPFAAVLMIGGISLALWSVIASAAVYVL